MAISLLLITVIAIPLCGYRVGNKERLMGDFFVKVQIITSPTPNILEIPIKVQFSVVTLVSTLFSILFELFSILFELSKGNSQT